MGSTLLLIIAHKLVRTSASVPFKQSAEALNGMWIGNDGIWYRVITTATRPTATAKEQGTRQGGTEVQG